MIKKLLALVCLLAGVSAAQVLQPANGGTGNANTVGIKMGSAAWDLSTFGGGIPKIASGGSGALSQAAASDVTTLFSGCSGTQYLGADGACHTVSGAFTYPGAGVPNSTGSGWGTSYSSSNLLPNNFLPNGQVEATFPAVGTTRFISATHYAGTFPANFSGATATCDTNPGGTVTLSVIVIHAGTPTTVGTVTLNTSCSATLATTGGTTQTFAADDRIAISPGGADSTAVNVQVLIPYTRN